MFKTPVLLKRMPFSPRLQLPKLTHRAPSTKDLKPSLEKLKYPWFPPKRSEKPHIRLARPKQLKRSITDVYYRPLPRTFKPNETAADYKKYDKIPKEKAANYHYPYKYYEITLRKSVLGLPARTRHIVQSLGLSKRHQVVWRLVSPRSAGQILKIKELVGIRLVNEIPPMVKRPTGFYKVKNLLKL